MNSLNISKDSKGFDDIDKFWSAVDSKAQEVEDSSDDEFAYDTSSTISESSDDTEEETEEVEEEISPIIHSSSSTPQNTTADKSQQSLESNLSASLSLHENEEDDEDTDAQEGSAASSEGEEEEKENETVKQQEVAQELKINLSSARKKSKGGEAPAEGGKKDKAKSRRQSKVQFEDETLSQEARRLSAPASLPAATTRSPSSSTKKKKHSPKKHQEEEQKGEDFTIDESSPFFVAGRISEIPRVNEDEDARGREEQSQSQHVNEGEGEDYDYDNNDVPFDDYSNVGEVYASSVRTPSSTRNKGGGSGKKSKKSADKAGEESDSNDGGDTGGSSIRKKKSSSSKKGSSKYQYFDTPGTTPVSRQTTPGGYVHGRDLPDESYRSEEEGGQSDDSEGMTDHGNDTTTDQSFVDTSYMQAARAGVVEGNSDTEEEEQPEEEGGPRRSRRATKGQRVQFWKNERPRYVKGRMVGILQAAPTPLKPPTKRTKTKRKSSSHKQNKRLFDGSSSEESSEDDNGGASRRKKSRKVASFPASRLPADVTFIPRKKVDTFSVWDDVITAPTNSTVIHLHEAAHPPTQLPITAVRPEGKDVVGVAAQSFNVPEIPGKMSGWISGFCELPPGGIKDAEGVGECCQVFQVASCQDGSVEFGLAHPSEEEWVDRLAQRTVLKSRDSFYVPPGNIYRLENHSTVEPCVIYWTIIRPMDEPEDEQASA